MIHQRKHPYLDEPGCFGCHISSVSFGAVAGGTRPAGKLKAGIIHKERGMVKYANRRKAGEQPDGISLEKIEQYDKRVETFAKMESNLREDNPPEVVDKFKKSSLNARK